jgi:hypothetical protein
MDSKEHEEHHEFLNECIPLLKEFLEDEKKRRERMDFIKKTALGAIVLAAIGATLKFLAWIGALVITNFNTVN